jgi:hypothetical protein
MGKEVRAFSRAVVAAVMVLAVKVGMLAKMAAVREPELYRLRRALVKVAGGAPNCGYGPNGPMVYTCAWLGKRDASVQQGNGNGQG